MAEKRREGASRTAANGRDRCLANSRTGRWHGRFFYKVVSFTVFLGVCVLDAYSPLRPIAMLCHKVATVTSPPSVVPPPVPSGHSSLWRAQPMP